MPLPISKKEFLGIVCLLILTAGILFLMGRTPLYAHGAFALWSSNVNSDQNSQQLFDIYTFTHLLHGFIFYLLLWLIAGNKIPTSTRLLLAVGIECSWEIIENTNFVINHYRAATISLDYYGDSIVNSVGDIFACIVGFILAARLPVIYTICIALFLEIALALFIRDNLILNIIMLIYPIPGIKAWQMGA